MGRPRQFPRRLDGAHVIDEVVRPLDFDSSDAMHFSE